MIDALYEIESYFGRLEAAMPKKELSEMYGNEAVDHAIQRGWIKEFRPLCRADECDAMCWLTENGKKQASAGQVSKTTAASQPRLPRLAVG